MPTSRSSFPDADSVIDGADDKDLFAMSDLDGARLSRRAFLASGATTVVGAGLLLGGCGGGGSSSGGGTYTGKEGIAHLQGIQTGAPFYVAQGKGYFAKHKLDLKDISTPGGTGAIQIIAGTTHIGMASTLGAIVAFGKHVPIRIVGGIYNTESTNFVAPANSSVSADSLRGKTIGTTSPDSITTYFGHLLVKKQGLVPNKDVKFVYCGDIPSCWTSAQKGLVDIAASNPPFSTNLVVQGKGKVVLEDSTLVPQFADNVLVATQPFIDSNGDVISRWLKALSQAINYIKTDTAGAAAIWGKGIGIPQSVAEKTLKASRDGFSLAINRPGIKANLAAGRFLGSLQGNPDLSDLIVEKYIPGQKEA